MALLPGFALSGQAQQTGNLVTIPLQDLDAFRDPGPNWTIASIPTWSPKKNSATWNWNWIS